MLDYDKNKIKQHYLLKVRALLDAKYPLETIDNRFDLYMLETSLCFLLINAKYRGFFLQFQHVNG